jgi:hypothetical protein
MIFCLTIFINRYPERDSLEPRMKNWRKNYADVQFYKFIVEDGEQDVKKQYNFKEPPAVVFFSGGNQLERISDFMESDPNASEPKGLRGESKDEKRLKARITYWCTNRMPQNQKALEETVQMKND